METVIKEMNNLLDDLKYTKARFDEVSTKIQSDEGTEELYQEEFMLVMELSGITGDLQLLASRFMNSQNEFMIKRILTEADKVFKSNTTVLKVGR